MGAAGLTCSSSEMAGKSGVGITMEVDKVPQREQGMTPYEIMLSESQERMLLIVKPEDFPKVQDVFHKWDLDAVVVGRVTADGMLKIIFNSETVAEIPAEYLILGGKAPVYTRDSLKPEWLEPLQAYDLSDLPEPEDYNQVLLKLFASPNIASKRAIYSQYDHMVQINTHLEPGADAAVVAIKGTPKAIALCTDCNGRYCYLDPFEGAKIAVAESARNVVCVGAKPLAITNCLNFGNPHKPEVYWTMQQAVKGMGDACRALDTPVTGGNVSLYNENPGGAIYPTPVIGMLGLIKDIDKSINHRFKASGDLIYILGGLCSELGGTEYLKVWHDTIAGKIPSLDIEMELRLQDLILSLIEEGILASAHDVSDGGMLCAVVESALETGLGVELTFLTEGSKAAIYFGEDQSRVIVSVKPENKDRFEALAKTGSIPVILLGKVMDVPNLIVNNDINLTLEALRQVWSNTIKI